MKRSVDDTGVSNTHSKPVFLTSSARTISPSTPPREIEHQKKRQQLLHSQIRPSNSDSDKSLSNSDRRDHRDRDREREMEREIKRTGTGTGKGTRTLLEAQQRTRA
ncbi:hypothetical protein OIU74_016115 [Salix koriyanagi]|uniref:Uncharacterized protein n=1 Tax=Salix koriyanagi TaxID=2511006 RepID=A0A9Q0PFZ0_9ROSI|nr:hypothetical protein OIU74_016115 [Salix koriyanagi]